MVKIVQNIILKSLSVVVVASGLAGCLSQQVKRNTDEVKIQKPNAPALSPMEYSWNTNYSAMLTPPIEIRKKALAACRQRGFDRAYMQTVSLIENMATAYFSCRGSDN